MVGFFEQGAVKKGSPSEAASSSEGSALKWRLERTCKVAQETEVVQPSP
jgi:hypothetical protein